VGGGLLSGDPEGYGGEGSVDGHLSMRGSLRNLVGGLSTGPCKGSGDRHLSPQRPC